MKRSFIREILESIDGETISFAGGLPDESLFPLKDLKRANMKVYENSSNLQYTRSNGLLELRENIARLYNEEGFDTDTDNILITTGSQQALYIIARFFKDKKIVIESPSYLGAVNAFKMNNLKISTLELKHDGINIEKFKRAYADAKLTYLIPDFQNPMSALYTQKKREDIADTILKIDGYIIEDAPYSELFFDRKAKSIGSLIPNNSFHLGSFSKTLSPSLRIGWIRANKKILKELITIKETIDLHTCSIAQHTLNNYLKNESQYKYHLQNLRYNYKIKMKFFATTLYRYLPEFHFKIPQGGMFIYGSLRDIDSFKLVQECIKQKVVFVPANQFYMDKKISDEIRFNFTHSSEDEIIAGIKKIATIYKDMKC